MLFLSATGLVIIGLIIGFLGTFSQSPHKNIDYLSPRGDPSSSYHFETIGFLPFWLLDYVKNDSVSQLTTVAYFGLKIGPNGHLVKMDNAWEEEPGWTTLRSDNIRTLFKQARQRSSKLSIVTYLSDGLQIAELLTQPEESARTLVDDLSPIINDYGFTNINLDIESFLKASSTDQEKLIKFIAEVRKNLSIFNAVTLTMEITPISLVRPQLTNSAALADLVDQVVLMAYDFHYSESVVAGPIAPVNGAGQLREYDVETAIKEAIKVVPKEKLILGIPLYGYEWETLSKSAGAPIIPHSGAIASQRRVNQLLSLCPHCEKGFDQVAKEAYVIFPDESGNYFHQIYYEDDRSIKIKFDLVNKYHLAGVAFWAVGYESNLPLEKNKPLSNH